MLVSMFLVARRSRMSPCNQKTLVPFESERDGVCPPSCTFDQQRLRRAMHAMATHWLRVWVRGDIDGFGLHHPMLLCL